MGLICIQNSVRWLPTATTPLHLDCCSVHLEETDGDQQRLSVRHVDDDEDGPGLYANVNAKGGQLQQTDPGTQTPEENVYMNVQDTKVKKGIVMLYTISNPSLENKVFIPRAKKHLFI